MADRYYLPELGTLAEVELTDSEAHHLLHVMRADVGDVVELFDGCGRAATAEIVSTKKKSATFKVLERVDDIADQHAQFTLACAVPKGDRFGWLVEKATELGVDRLIPLETERSIVHPGDGKLDKMRQTVIAACKQSRRNRLMMIEEKMTWKTFLEHEASKGTTMVAHPSGDPFAKAAAVVAPHQPIIAAIGPEGGFTEAEIEVAVSAGVKPVSLGRTILRTETAAIAMSAFVKLQHSGI